MGRERTTARNYGGLYIPYVSIAESKEHMPNLKDEVNYKEYLKSAHWRDVRRKYWASKAEKSCHFCKSTNGLALHHKYGYRRMYEENQNHLVLLCKNCHRYIHEHGNWKLDYKSVYKGYQSLRARSRRKRKLGQPLWG